MKTNLVYKTFHEKYFTKICSAKWTQLLALCASVCANLQIEAQKNRKVYKDLGSAVESLSNEGKTVEALKFVLAKTGASALPEEHFSRADLLERLGHYQLALAERVSGVSRGKLSAAQLSRIGELALVTDRLEPLANLSVQLNRAGSSSNSWPVGFRAGLAALYLRIGDFNRAAMLIPSSSDISRLSPAAAVKAYHVSAAIDFAQGRMESSLNTLQNAAGVKAFNPGLANLQRSRIFFEQGKYNQSLEELVFIPRNNTAWFSGVLTAAWSAYHLRDYNLALGQLMTLINPYLSGKFNPEAWILESNVLYRLCHFQSSLNTLKTLRERYQDFPAEINRFQRTYGGRFQGVSALLSFARGQDPSQSHFSKAHWGYLADGVLSDEGMIEVDRAVMMADNSEKFIRQSLSGANSAGVKAALNFFRQNLDASKREAYRKGVKIMDRRLREMTADTESALEGAMAIEVEINTRIRERLILGTVPKMKDIDFEAEVNKGYEFWPYQGEFWRDEAGSFVFATSDVCGSVKEGT